VPNVDGAAEHVSMLPVVAGLCALLLDRLQSMMKFLLASVQLRSAVVEMREEGWLPT
jgi:hypothetical protein